MKIDAMITRRRRRSGRQRLVLDADPLSPVAHLEEPTDRSQLVERLLDHLDAVFEGRLPANGYLYGPKGAGKSALVTVLFRKLGELVGSRETAIYTNTRVNPSRELRFAYVDMRTTSSEFSFYRSLLQALTDEHVPRHGLSTAAVRERLGRSVDGASAGLVVAVDHVAEPDTAGAETTMRWVGNVPGEVSWLAVGRTHPTETPLTDGPADPIPVEAYRRHVVGDILLERVANGVDRPGLDHDAIERVATWADGDAHDALAALFVACDRADRADRAAVSTADLTTAIESVPRPCVALGRVLALRANKQTVLRRLVDLDPDDRASVTAATAAVADTDVDLAAGTIQRYIYELAESGIIERVQTVNANVQGRPPSRLEPRFPATVFRRLFDAEN